MSGPGEWRDVPEVSGDEYARVKRDLDTLAEQVLATAPPRIEEPERTRAQRRREQKRAAKRAIARASRKINRR